MSRRVNHHEVRGKMASRARAKTRRGTRAMGRQGRAGPVVHWGEGALIGEGEWEWEREGEREGEREWNIRVIGENGLDLA